MPVTLAPRALDSGHSFPKVSETLRSAAESRDVKRYKYAHGLKLRPGQEQHDQLRDEIMRRAQNSHSQLSGRHASWQKVDEQLTSYVPLSDYDKLKDGASVQTLDPNKPVSIVMPVSYAVLETLLTHLTASFLDLPHFKLDGVGGEDVEGAMLLEQVLMVQNAKTGIAANLHTMFRDALVYGIGPVAISWDRKQAFRRTAQETGFFNRLGNFMRTGVERQRETYTKWEGNVMHNIDPYSYFPDTSVSADEVHRMEYVGYLRNENVNEALSREQTDESYFNARYLPFIDGRSIFGVDLSARDRDSVQSDHNDGTTNQLDTIYMVITLVPKQWGLGPEEFPVPWLFGLAGDQVIVKAEPLSFDHNEKPMLCYAPDYDGYSAAPISKMESIYGIQHLVNFLYNSHIANVRKAINDMLLVDPELVNINDVLNPSPAKVLRLRKRAWGRGVQGAIEQLKITDITTPHLQEVASLILQAQNFSGATDSLQGAQRRSGERVSATEFEGTQLAALSRLEKAARVAGYQVMTRLGEQMASNTQQFMQEEAWVQLKGRNEEDLRAIFGSQLKADEDRVRVAPEELLIAYDVLVNDGSLPNQGNPQLWSQMFTIIASQPELAQQFDMVRIFKHWARLNGAKSVEDFIRSSGQVQTQVLENEDVEREAQAGNLVPISEAG